MYPKHIIKVVLGSILLTVVIGQSRNYFDRHCPKDSSNRFRRCKLYVTENLDFNDFRLWTSTLGDLVKVSLEVTCSEKGQLFLPSPMKAKGLVKLHVDSCTIDGFFSEFNKTTNLKDKLEELVIENSVVLTSLRSILNSIYKPVSKEFDCSQQTVHISVWRNVSYAFPDETALTPKEEVMFMSSADELIRKSMQKMYKCRYPNLEFMDKSICATRSRNHLHLMTAYSEYPKLQTFLMANNGFREIPQEFVEWQSHFPELTYLDLSHNNIEKLDFLKTPRKSMTRARPLTLDLSFNEIKTIPQNIAEYLSGAVPIVVDLTDNPLNCNCDFLRYKRYISEVVKRFPEQKKLSLIKCFSKTMNRKFEFADVDYSNCQF